MQTKTSPASESLAPESLAGTLDRALRGSFLAPEQLATGRIDAPLRRLGGLALGLGATYGASIGCFTWFRGGDAAWLQTLASAAKVPLLFVLTLLVTYPSLYVFAALQRLPLDFRGTLRLLLLAILVHVAILASLAPVFAFFAASTESYSFMLLLNVGFFAVGGLLGLSVLRRATRLLFTPATTVTTTTISTTTITTTAAPRAPATATATGESPADGAEARPRTPMHSHPSDAVSQARRVLAVWCVVYGVVGAQMGWLLRPFLGAPGLPFTLFRPREENVFLGIAHALANLFGR